MMAAALASVVVGYLVGAIPFAVLVPRWWAGVDVRTVGSGNPGATNVWRATTPSLAALVAGLDMAKGAVAVALARWVGAGEPWAAVAGVAAVVGHVSPVWLRGRGGKGVATGAGVFAVLAPGPTAAAAAAWLVVAALTRYASLGSLAAAVVLPVLLGLAGASRSVIVAAVAVAALVVVRHRTNLARLRAGTEWRLGRRGAGPTSPSGGAGGSAR
jgi:glycerol-3-phosphate acyltransferase PlsY